MAVCVALGVEVLMGVAGNYLDLTPAHIEAMVKTAIVLADLSVVELFLSSLQYYFQLSLSTLRDTLSRVFTDLPRNSQDIFGWGCRLRRCWPPPPCSSPSPSTASASSTTASLTA